MTVHESLLARLAELEQENATLKRQVCEMRTIPPTSCVSQRIHALLDHLPLLVFAHDAQLRIVFWNRESQRVTGYSREFMLQHPNPLAVLYPDIAPELLQQTLQRHHAQDYRELKVPLVCADGGVKVVSFSNISNAFPLPGWWSWQIGFDATPSNLASARLKEIKEQVRAILELSPEAILLHRQENIDYANIAAKTLFGDAAAQGPMQPDMRQLFNSSQHGNNAPSIQCIHANGEDKYVEILSSSMYHQRKPTTLTLVRDMTLRVLHEQELRRSRNVFRVLLDATNDFFILADTSFVIKACNSAWSSLFARHPREIVGRTILALLPRRIRKSMRDRGLECCRSNTPIFFVLEYEGRKLNCKIFPLATDGVVEQLAFYAHDATQILQAQQARAELELRYKAVFDHAGDAIFIYDQQGSLLAANSTLCDLLDSTESELQTMSLDALLSNHVDWRGLFSRKQQAAAMWELRRKGGAVAPLEINARPIPYLDVPAVLCVGRDVSKWRAAQEMLQQARDTAEETVRMQNEFVANISHELRTPLNAIIGLTELLTLAPLDANSRNQVRRIGFSADFLLNLINDLLDLAKLESGSFTLEKRPFSLLDLMQKVKDMLVLQAVRKGLDFAYAVDDGLADVYLGDAPRLRQVLLNIAGNAVKFTSRGHVRVLVKQEPSSRPGSVCLHFIVSDTGVGIAAQDLPRIFQRFAQANGGQGRTHGGAGLGLAISRDFVRHMGGAIWATSTPGQGSDFHFTVVLEPNPETQVAGSEAALACSLPPLHRRLLLVEDNDINRDVLKAMLELDGHEVQTAAHGLEALARLDAFTPDLVFMDVQMPHLDGLETTRRIRALPDARLARVPIVALSAHAQRESAAACLEAGMNLCLTKPTRLEELRRVVADLGSASHASHPGASCNPECLALDLAVLERNMGQEPSLMRIVCEKFLEHATSSLAEIQDAATRLDAPALVRLGHSFKSMAGTIGAEAARSIATRLEQQAAAGNLQQAVHEVAALEAAVEEAIRSVVTLQARLGADHCRM